MTPSQPYLIRALYEWILDNGMTPHVVVDVDREGVSVPAGYVEDGRIVLNIAPQAVESLDLGNETIGFSARFGGRETLVSFPVSSVAGIYARENGRGMLFPEAGREDDGGDDEEPDPPQRPSLKLVK